MHPNAKHVVTSISFLFLLLYPLSPASRGCEGLTEPIPAVLIFQFLKIFNVWIMYIIFVMKNSHTVTSCGLVLICSEVFLVGGPGWTLWWRHGQRGGFSLWIAKTEHRGIFGGGWVQVRWSLTSLSCFLFVNSVYPAPTLPYWWLDPLQVLHSCHRRESCLDQYNPVKQQVCCVSRMLLQWQSFNCNFSVLFFPQDTITSIGIYSTGQRSCTFMRNKGGDQSWFTSSVFMLLGWGGSCLEGFSGRLGLLGGRCGGLWWLSEKGEAEAERGRLHLHEAVSWSYATCVWPAGRDQQLES